MMKHPSIDAIIDPVHKEKLEKNLKENNTALEHKIDKGRQILPTCGYQKHPIKVFSAFGR